MFPSLLAARSRLARFVSNSFDPYWDNVSALLHFDGADGSTKFVDEAGNFWSTQSPTPAAISTAQSKFGAASVLTNNSSNGNLHCPYNARLNLASSDFTIEFWIYNTATTGNQQIFNKDGVFGSTYNSYAGDIDANRKFVFGVGSGNSVSYFQPMASTAVIPLNTWTYIAVTRSGTTVNIFINGALDSTFTITGTPIDGGKGLYIGSYASNSEVNDRFQGYIDEFRITKGVVRYTASFNPPSLPFTSWDPSRLFTAGVRGAYYDFNDLSTMFQDTAGTIPVTAVGQSVALVLDKSGNGQHISQATAGNRPVLQNDGYSYYLSYNSTYAQWLERDNTNNLYPGTQSLLGAVACSANADGTAYSRALAGPGSNRYTIGFASSRADSGAYQWPSSNLDAQTAAVTRSDKAVLSQTIDRQSGVNKIWYLSENAVVSGTSAVDIGNANMTNGYRFRVGAYGNSSDTSPQSMWNGSIYGVILVFQDTISYSDRDNLERWMRKTYGI